ncbi:hypothetical protein [Natribacillus halophilus]|uniref:Serine hydroxymethyltransferase n=1 Tax=Natribacillus halophilus TaxID=549003 RepID=A0A1G8N159_9BACI|nr:Serine hydroxymethyltransferase [Natribacillus halophilus]
MSLEHNDPFVSAAIEKERERQRETLELIASENFVSDDVLEAMGSVMTNKYAEGYAGRRFYGSIKPSSRDFKADLSYMIAAKAVSFKESLQPDFKTYAQNNVDNASVLGETLLEEGASLGGTDNHLLLVDVKAWGLTGKETE